MSTLSLSLGDYWNDFIDEKIAEGRYVSASEVVREALRLLEERDYKSYYERYRRELEKEKNKKL